MSDIDVESDDELKSRSTPLSRFGDFKQVKRLLAKGKRDLSGGLFTDRDRMALAMQSSSSLNKLNYLFRQVLWQTFMYQRRFVTPNESYSHRIPSGTLVIGIKGKRKGSYGLISGYDVVRKSYLVEWTVSGEKKHKKIKRFGQWFFVDGQGRRAKQNWIRVVTWGGIDTNTYLQSFLPNKNEALFQDNKSQWKCLRQERANIQKTFVEAGGPIDIPGRFHQNALFLLSSAQHQCEIFQCPHDAGDAITLLRLLSWGADPNVHLEIHGTSSKKPPFYGETPLLVAAKRGDLDCYRLLIMFGANKKYREYSETEKKRAELLSERYEGGPTPLSIAKKHWPLETISIMNSLEADNTTTSDKYIWDYSNCCYVKK